jgi:hypothetical protein
MAIFALRRLAMHRIELLTQIPQLINIVQNNAKEGEFPKFLSAARSFAVQHCRREKLIQLVRTTLARRNQ